MRHIAQWRSVKYVDEFNEEGETEGQTIIRKRERFSHELTLAYESGHIVELKETKEARHEKTPISDSEGSCIAARLKRRPLTCASFWMHSWEKSKPKLTLYRSWAGTLRSGHWPPPSQTETHLR